MILIYFYSHFGNEAFVQFCSTVFFLDIYSSYISHFYKHINQFSLLCRVNVMCFTEWGDETFSLNTKQKIIKHYDREEKVRPSAAPAKSFGFRLRMYKILCECKKLSFRFRRNLYLGFFRGHSQSLGRSYNYCKLG